MSGDHTVVERRPIERRSNRPLLVAIIALIVLALVALILAKVFSAKPITKAQPAAPINAPNILNAPKVDLPATPSITEGIKPQPAKPDAPVQAPPEVLQYLAHLKRAEEYRQQMNTELKRQAGNDAFESLKQMSDALKAGNEDPLDAMGKAGDGIRNLFSKNNTLWINFSRYFDSLPPPEPCKAIYIPYKAALQDIVSNANKVQTSASQGSIGDLIAMQGASTTIDNNFEKANEELQKVCDQYNIKKDFDIKGDRSGTGIGSMLGAGGLGL